MEYTGFYYEDYGYNDDLIPMGYVESGMEFLSGMGEEFTVTMEQMEDTAHTGASDQNETTEIKMSVGGTVIAAELSNSETLKPYRKDIVIASKFGVHHSPEGMLVMDSAPATIRESVEGSLKRLQTDYIDLYYQHRIDPKIPAEEVAGVMSELIQEGKILHWSISETDERYLRKAHAVCPVTCIQNRYSMMARWYENLFPVLEDL